MRTLATVLVLAALAGCVAPEVEEPPVAADGDGGGATSPAPDGGAAAAPSTAAPAAGGAAPEPVVQEISGRITSSATSRVAHVNPEVEMAVADVQREGFLLEIKGVPQVLQLDLAWTAATPGSTMFAMVNIPTATDGKVVDLFSERGTSGSVCMRVPIDAIQTGLLSVMAHSIDAAGVDWTMRVTSIGGEVVLHEDRGHMEVERDDAEERDALPCA